MALDTTSKSGSGKLLSRLIPLSFLTTHRVAFRQFLVRAISRRYRLSAFGALWMIVVPLVTLGIYTFVFGVVMESRWNSEQSGTSVFSIYLFSGLIVFWVMAEVVGQSPTAIAEHTNLVKRAVFPLEILPAVVVGSAVFHALVNALVLMAALLALQGTIPLSALWLPVVLAPFVLMLLGFAWILAAIGVYFRDIVHVVGLFLTGALFISPVFYDTSRLNPIIQSVIILNPITFIVVQTRKVILEGQAPDWIGLGLYLLVAWAVASIGLAFFRRARANFADVL